MKKDIHPTEYQTVIFHDNASGEEFLISSTLGSDEMKKWEDGNEYPVVHVEISSASHPFYTGTEKRLDTAGRAEKFRLRMEKAAK